MARTPNYNPDYAENPFIDELLLPVAQPPGLAAFADAASILTSPRRFLAAELGPYHGLGAETHLDCLVSFQQLEGAFHFCIAHRWGELSPASNDQFRNIATILARQAIEFTLPEAKLIFYEGKHGEHGHRELIREVNAIAKKFHFYRHLLPRRDLGEQFCRVEMIWDGARFIDPDFSVGVYSSVPLVLREAVEKKASGAFFEKKGYPPGEPKKLL